MVSPRPVSLVADPNPNPALEAEPLVVVGGVPVAPADVVNLTAVPATFADLAAVRAYLNTLVTELKSSKHFN